MTSGLTIVSINKVSGSHYDNERDTQTLTKEMSKRSETLCLVCSAGVLHDIFFLPRLDHLMSRVLASNYNYK